MNLPQWLLQLSVLLGGAVFLNLLAERIRLPLTVVLAVVGFIAASLVGALCIASPLHG